MKFEIPRKDDSEMLLYIWKIIDLPSISKRDLLHKISFELFLFSPEKAIYFIERCIENGLLIKINNKKLKLEKNLDEKLKAWHKKSKIEILKKKKSSEKISDLSRTIESIGTNFNILMKAFLDKETLNRAALISDSSFDIRIFDQEQGIIEADVEGSKENNYFIKININNKTINHNCHDFITRRANNKKFCKHLVKLFLILKEKYSDSADFFLNSISKQINEWDFSS